MGLSATETTRNSKANELYGKSFKDLSESQKQLTLLGMVEDANKASGALGQASRESDGLSNVLGNLKQAWTDFMAEAGKPVLAVAIPVMKGLTSVIVFLTGKIKDFYGFLKEGANVSDSFTNIADRIRGAFAIGNFGALQTLIPTLIESLVGGLPRMLQVGTDLIYNLANGMNMSVPELIALPVTIMGNVLQGFIRSLPSILSCGMQIVTGLVNGIITALPIVITAITSMSTMIVNTVTQMLPQLLNMGVTLLLNLVNGILSALPTLITSLVTMVTTIVNTLITYFTTALPLIINAGLQLLQGLITGLVQNLPLILTAVLTLLTGLVNALMTNLPMIIQAGIQILNALINGIIQMLPSLITTALQLVDLLINSLIQNLPLIISAGIQLLVALVNGVLKALPKLIPMVYQLIIKITATVIANLPLIISAGVQILMALIKGIIQMIPTLVGSIPKIVSAIFKAFSGVDWGSIGKQIMSGIGAGIKRSATAVFGTVKEIASGLLRAGKKKLGIGSPSKVFADQVGKMIPEGIAIGIKANSDIPNNAISNMSKSMVASGQGYSIKNIVRDNPTVASTSASPNGVGNDLVIPLTVQMDGKDFIKTTIRLTQDYLADLQRKQNRLNGQYA